MELPMHWEILIVPLIAFAVWILSSLLKEAEEPVKGRPRGEGGPQRGRRPPSEVDRALAQRRAQRSEAERNRDPGTQPFGPSDRRGAEPMPAALQRERPEKEQPRRAEQRRPQPPPQPSPAPPARRLLDQPVAPPKAKPAPVELAPQLAATPAPAQVGVRPAPPAAPPGAPPAVTSALQKPNVAPTVTTTEPVLAPLMQLLRSPQSARLAFILREIIDPPLCRRPRRPHS
jgi:hypothetical protein